MSSDEELVRAALQVTASGTPDADDTPVQRLETRGRRRRHRRTLTAAGALGAVGALAVTVGASAALSARPDAVDTVAQSMRVPAGASAVPCSPTTADFEFGEPRDGTDTTMVPGTPHAAIVCRYDGIRSAQAAPLPLIRSGRIEGEHLSNLVDSLDTSPAATPRRCPPDFGAATVVVATFVYRDGPSVTVRWGTGPCAVAANGAKSVEVPTALSLPPYWN